MAYSAYAGVPHACARCGNETLRVIDGAFDEARSAARELAPGDHALLAYEEPDDVSGFCARYLAEGVAAGDRVLAALPGELDGKVRSLLTDQVADGVDWQDSAAIYGDFDADRISNMYDEIIEGEDRPVRIIAGPDRADTMTLDELDRLERLAHGIVIDRAAIALCLFDSNLIPADLIEVASRRHTLAVSAGVVHRNEQFEYAPA
jgi:hypothetical protein